MDWERGKCLGKGSYGSVYLAIPQDLSSHPIFVVKSAPFMNSLSLQKEYRILQVLRHRPGIVQTYGFSISHEPMPVFNLKMEYAEGGSLFDLIRKNPGTISERHIRRYTEMILKGLSCIHGEGYVHCDLKPGNILLFPSQRDICNLKIADFGVSKEPGECDSSECFTGFRFRGTPAYMSPESVAYGVNEPPLDVWSLGCIVVEMVTGKQPWQVLDMGELLARIGSGMESPKIPETMSVKGKDFLKRCFERDPRRRWTANMLLQHPFITMKSLHNAFRPKNCHYQLHLSSAINGSNRQWLA